MAKEEKNAKKEPKIEDFHEEIRKRAQELFNKRTEYNNSGDTLTDWLQAEKEIKEKYGIK